jgi:hypothetical protein
LTRLASVAWDAVRHSRDLDEARERRLGLDRRDARAPERRDDREEAVVRADIEHARRRARRRRRDGAVHTLKKHRLPLEVPFHPA